MIRALIQSGRELIGICRITIHKLVLSMLPRNITIERLQEARIKVAQLVLIDRVYLPIFERLENEIATRHHEDDLVARATAIVNG